MAENTNYAAIIREAIEFDSKVYEECNMSDKENSSNVPQVDRNGILINEIIIDKELFDILSSWNLSHLYQKCIDHGVYYQNLPHLSTRIVSLMFGKHELGDQASFEYYLFKWQRNNVSPQKTIGGKQNEQANSSDDFYDVQVADNDTPGSPKSKELMNVKSILMRTEIGKSILSDYNIEKTLNESIRQRICQLIADYYITEKNIKPGVVLCRKITLQIISVFPTEIYETFLNYGKKNVPQGKLYDKLHNINKRERRFLKKEKQPEGCLKNKNCRCSICNETTLIKSTDPNIDIGKMQRLMAELKHLRSPWNEVLMKWQDTSAFRIKEMMGNKDITMENLIQEWPLYQHAQAPELITKDFYQYFTTKNSIYTNWEKFVQKIPLIYESSLKDPVQKSLLKELLSNKDTINIDTFNLELLYMLPQILPTGVVMSKNKINRTTRLDAQAMFIIKAADSGDLEAKLEIIRKNCLSTKRSLQPLVAAIGSHLNYNEFFVVFDSIKYKFGSFLESINICYFIFNLFNLMYPDQCSNVWIFIQIFFFNMKNSFDQKASKVLTLINDINK